MPSTEHDKVPYYEILLSDYQDNYYIKKSFENFEIGDLIELDFVEANVHKVEKQISIGILGTGLMGKQLAQFFALNGYLVILYSRSERGLEKALEKIEKDLAKMKDSQEIENILKRIDTTNNLSSFVGMELIIETIIEDMDIKKQLYRDLCNVCPQNIVIATNTSSLPITELATSVSCPERFIGMHFFNPVQKMHLVEVVCGQNTSKQTIEYVRKLSLRLGKTPIMVHDSPGFIVNRSLMPFINEAASLLREDVSPISIDTAIKLGLNHPMGPLALADLIGLDVCVSILNTLYKKFKDAKYIPSPVFYKLIHEGHLGKKTGRGFYEYNS